MIYELAGGTGAAEASRNKDGESPGMAAAESAMRALRREPSIGRGQVYGSEDTPDHVDAGIEVEFLGPDESQAGTPPSPGQRHNSKLAEWGNGRADMSANSVVGVKPGDVAGAGESAHNEFPLHLLHKEEDLPAASTNAQLPDEMLGSDVEAVTQLPSLEDSGAAQVGTATEDAGWRSRLGNLATDALARLGIHRAPLESADEADWETGEHPLPPRNPPPQVHSVLSPL